MTVSEIALCLLPVIVVLFAVSMIRLHKRDKEFRESILRDKPRMDDAEYLEKLSFPVDGEDKTLALEFRAAFAGLSGLPRECITPDMPLVDLFRAQASFFSDGIDQAEIIMELEDQLDVEIPEDSSGLRLGDDDTVGTCTAKILEYARKTWAGRLAEKKG